MRSSKKLTGFHLQEAQQRAAERAKMLVGATGDVGAQGRQGEIGSPGIDAVGKAGVDGERGEQGFPGKQGDHGHGIKGDQGEKGDDGRKGDDGEDGRGITSTKIIRGDLWVFYTDGTKQNAGKLPRGKDGMHGRVVSSGSGSGATWKPLEIFTLSAQNIVDGYIDLTAIPKSHSEFVFVNGLAEDCYTLTTNRLDFSLLGLLAGEKLTVKYQI